MPVTWHMRDGSVPRAGGASSLCAASVSDESHCCGYFDPAVGDVLQVEPLPYPCRDLLFKDDLLGFVYPRVDFVYGESVPGGRC